MHAVLGARRPAVAARLLERRPDGTVLAEALAEGAAAGPAGGGAGKAGRVVRAVERVFRLGAGLLSTDEWSSLFSRRTPRPDDRWALLVRLATEPAGREGELRDQFAALPDGTAFSMRLLLSSMRGGGRDGAGDGEEGGRGVSFNRLPDVARLLTLACALRRLDPARPVTPKELAAEVEREAGRLGLPVAGLTGKDVTDRLFKKVRDNGGGAWLPTLAAAGRGRKRRPGPSAGEGARDG
jgi:hypothetical protein